MSDPKDEQIERLADANKCYVRELENKDKWFLERINSLQEQRDTLRAEVARLKEELAKETKSFTWLSKRRDEMQARIDSDERIFKAKDEDIAMKDALITDARDEHKRLWAIIDARSSEGARLTEQLDITRGEAQHANQEINEIVKQRDETIARLTADTELVNNANVQLVHNVTRLTAEMDELGNKLVLAYAANAAFSKIQESQATQLAELRKDGERKASLLAQAYCWVGVNNPIVSPRDEEVRNLKFALKPYWEAWEALDAARKEKL